MLVLAFSFFATIWRGLGHALQIGDVAVLLVGLPAHPPLRRAGGDGERHPARRAAALWPQAARLVLLVSVLAGVLVTIVYSYIAYWQVVRD